MKAMGWLVRGGKVFVSHWKRLVLGAAMLFLFNMALLALRAPTYMLPLKNAPNQMSLGSVEKLPGWAIAVVVVLYLVCLILDLGYEYFVLRAVRQQEPSFIDIFFPFKRPFAVIGVDLLIYLAITVAAIPELILFAVDRLGTAWLALAAAVTAFPAIFVLTALFFGDIALIDRGLSPSKALRESWRITKGHRLAIFLLFLFFIVIGGCIEVLIWLFGGVSPVAIAVRSWIYSFLNYFLIMPWSYSAYMCAYAEISAEAHPEEGPKDLPV